MEDQLLLEQFHETFDIEPRPGSFDRLRSTIIRQDWQTRAPRRFRLAFPRMGVRLAAAIALLILGVASVGAFIAINEYTHRSVLVHPAPFKVNAPGSPVCYSGCQVSEVSFTSASSGFLLETKVVSSDACVWCPAPPVVLFRTTDAGRHWRELTTPRIDCCQPRLIASGDGNQLLLLGSPGSSSVLLYSKDAGATWSRHGLPQGAGKAIETGCKQGQCVQRPISPLVYFIDPRNGWVLSQEQTFNIADLYRTTDAGASWTLLGRLDVNKLFGLDLASGTRLGDNSLFGQLVFSTDSVAWFVPLSPCVSDLASTTWARNRVFRSADGGIDWTPIDLASPTGLTGSSWLVPTVTVLDARNAVLELVVNPRLPCDPASSGQVVEDRFVYTTADGGITWSTPVSVPEPSYLEEMRYIDPQHWVGWPYGGGWISTSDAGKTWNVVQSAGQFGDPPVPGQGLPVQLPASRPNAPFGFVDSVHGWALPYRIAADPNARGVALYLTNDGGQSWLPASLPELK
jgi:photosystem II stability/assembly factor-like uncharacterized protein